MITEAALQRTKLKNKISKTEVFGLGLIVQDKSGCGTYLSHQETDRPLSILERKL